MKIFAVTTLFGLTLFATAAMALEQESVVLPNSKPELKSMFMEGTNMKEIIEFIHKHHPIQKVKSINLLSDEKFIKPLRLRKNKNGLYRIFEERLVIKYSVTDTSCGYILTKEIKRMSSNCNTAHGAHCPPHSASTNMKVKSSCSEIKRCSIYADFNGKYGTNKFYFVNDEQKNPENCIDEFKKNSGGVYQDTVKSICKDISNYLGGNLTYYLKYEIDGKVQSPIYGDWTCI